MQEVLEEADLEDLEARLYCQVYHTNPDESQDIPTLEPVTENNTVSSNITTTNKRYFKSFSSCGPAKEKPSQETRKSRKITRNANGNSNISTTNVSVHNSSTVDANGQVKQTAKTKKSNKKKNLNENDDSRYEITFNSLLRLKGLLNAANQNKDLPCYKKNELNTSFNNIHFQMTRTDLKISARNKKLRHWNFLISKLRKKLNRKPRAVKKRNVEERTSNLSKSAEKELGTVEVICLSDSDDDNDSVIEIPRDFPLVCLSDSESQETTSLITADNRTGSTVDFFNTVIKQELDHSESEVDQTADVDSISPNASTSAKTIPDIANTHSQHEVSEEEEEEEHDNDDVVIVENPKGNEVIDLDSDNASDNQETDDQNINETLMYDDNSQSYDHVTDPDKNDTTQESLTDLNATTEGTSYEFLNSCNASAQNSPNSGDPVLSGSRTEFARPANPCEVYESGGSSTTSECVARILIPVVFNEEEFPQDDMFSEDNLEKFKHLISTPKQGKAKSRKQSRESLKSAADDKNEEGEESDEGEELNESSNKTFKKLPNLSSMDKDSGSDKKKNRKNFKEDNNSQTTTPTETKKSKKRRTNSEISTEMIVEADTTTTTDQLGFETKKTKKRKTTEVDVDISEPNLQKKKSKKKRKQSGCESNQDEQDIVEMDTTGNDANFFDLTCEFQNNGFVIVDEYRPENKEADLDQSNVSDLNDSALSLRNNAIERCLDKEPVHEVHSTTDEPETSMSLVQGSSNDIVNHPESHSHSTNSQKELVPDLTINVTSTTRNKKSRFENHWNPNKDIFNSTIINVKDFDVEKICGKLSSDPQLWQIVHLDAINYRSVRGTGLRCRKCREYGHAAVRCHNKAGPIVCSMCAAVGHSFARCPNKLCNWCGDRVPSSISVCRKCIRFRHHVCNVCQVKGHSEDYCPDLWRRYHLTTEVGPLKKPSGTYKHPRKSCCICANIGHTEDSCRKALGYKISTHVHLYDDVYNNRDGSRVMVADNLQNVGNVNGIHPTPPSPREIWEMQNQNNRLGEFNPNNMQITHLPFQHYIPQTRMQNSSSQPILPIMNFPPQFVPMQQFIPLSPSKFQADVPVPQKEMYDFITTRPLHVVQNFLKEKLSRLSSFNCDAVFLEGLITCLENMPNPKPDQLSLAYMHLNMLVFGICNYAEGGKHLDHIRQFQQIPSHHRLKKCKRVDLWNSYSYIFGTIKHSPQSTVYLRRIILNTNR